MIDDETHAEVEDVLAKQASNYAEVEQLELTHQLHRQMLSVAETSVTRLAEAWDLATESRAALAALPADGGEVTR